MEVKKTEETKETVGTKETGQPTKKPGRFSKFMRFIGVGLKVGSGVAEAMDKPRLSKGLEVGAVGADRVVDVQEGGNGKSIK